MLQKLLIYQRQFLFGMSIDVNFQFMLERVVNE